MDTSHASHLADAPDRRNAGHAGVADRMQNRADKRGHPASARRTKAEDARRELRDNVNVKSDSITTTSHTAKSSASQTSHANLRQQPSDVSGKEFAHPAALHRLNGSKSSRPPPPNSASTASTQPVLVRAYPNPSQSSATKSTEMRRKRQSASRDATMPLPPLSSFSFEDIWKEIDAEINPSVEAIAEIFGRSKLSLADEYGSHLPPQGELTFPASQGQSEILEAIPNSKLETVEEAPHGHGKRRSLALVGASPQQKGGASLATSTASVEPTAKAEQENGSSAADVKASLMPYVVSWLKGSNGGTETRSRRASTDPRAAEALHKILGEG